MLSQEIEQALSLFWEKFEFIPPGWEFMLCLLSLSLSHSLSLSVPVNDSRSSKASVNTAPFNLERVREESKQAATLGGRGGRAERREVEKHFQ